MKKGIVLLLIMVMFLGGCQHEKQKTSTEPKEVVIISGVSIAPWPMKTVMVGDSETFNAIVTPLNATNQNVTWTSSDTSVATIDSNGTMTALKVGETNITAITDAGNYTSTCLITVVENNDTGAMPALGIGVTEDEYQSGTGFLEIDE